MNRVFHQSNKTGINYPNLFKTIKQTLGPTGQPLMLDNGIFTKSAFKTMKYKYNQPAGSMSRLLKDIAYKQQFEAFDGTSSATLIGMSLMDQQMRNNFHYELVKGVRIASQKVMEHLQKIAVPFQEQFIPDIAKTGANGHDDIALLISNIFSKLGTQATMTIKYTNDNEGL